MLSLSRETILIHTSSCHSSICRKHVKVSFVWIFLKYQNRSVVTPWMTTLIVSWASTCLVIVQYTNPVPLIQLLISNILWCDGHLFKQQTRSRSNESFFFYLTIKTYTECNLVYILKAILKCKRIPECRHRLPCNRRQKCTLKWFIMQKWAFQVRFSHAIFVISIKWDHSNKIYSYRNPQFVWN